MPTLEERIADATRALVDAIENLIDARTTPAPALRGVTTSFHCNPTLDKARHETYDAVLDVMEATYLAAIATMPAAKDA